MVLVVYTVKSQDLMVTSQIYPLDGDFNKIYATAHLEFVLTQVDSEPSVTIEAQQWVHVCCISVSTKSSDGMYPLFK